MNGQPLPDLHGGPVRLLIPGQFGEKSVKWVTGVEVVDRDVQGFYEQQGWGPGFTIPTRSQFLAGDFAAALGAAVHVRGWAFGGDRGISRVEVSTDGGAAWRPATIERAGTRLTWSLWTFAFQPTAPGDYHLVVRATDGRGDPQIAAYRDTHPEGATGLHAITVRVSASA
jgi:DMSO/TMAO reductase YedYZ molybdopterin-dependent catalytic subunit